MLALWMFGAELERRWGTAFFLKFYFVTGIGAGLLTVLAGLLLFLPGFLTDLVGVALLIGPVRRWCGRTFRRWVRRRNPADRSTIDLAQGEWHQLPERELPYKPGNRD